MRENIEDILILELKLWLRKSNKLDNRKIEALGICNNIYSNILRFFQVLEILPFSTFTAEKSFSTLKRIQIYLWNTTSEVKPKFNYIMNIKLKVKSNLLRY